jgi:hypothetical protein
MSAAATFPVSVSESATGTDAFAAAAQVIGQIQESVTAADAFYARHLWELIDDSQNAQWSDVLKAQTLNSVATFGGMGFAEIAYTSALTLSWYPAPTTWSGISTTQSAGWTSVIVPQTINGVHTYGDLFFADVATAGSFNRTWVPSAAQWREIDTEQVPDWTLIEDA